MSKATIHSKAAIVNNIRAFVAEKQAAVVDTANNPKGGDAHPPEKDPADKGKPNMPASDEAGKDKSTASSLPGARAENKGECEDNIPAGQGVNAKGNEGTPPSAESGNSKEDAFTSPGTDLSKIAHRSKKVAAALSGIMGNKQASAAPAAEAGADAGEGDAPVAEAGTNPKAEGVAPKAEGGDKPKSGEAAPEKTAGEEDILAGLDENLFGKISHDLLSCEAGRYIVRDFYTKKAGAEAAEKIVKHATEQHHFILQQAHVKRAFQEAFDQLDDAGKAQVKRASQIHATILDSIDEPLYKSAYVQGAEEMAAMEDTGSIPGGDMEQPPTLEEIVAVLEAMVAAGELGEEEAIAILQELAGGMEGGGGEAAPMPVDPAAAVEAPPVEGEPKAASADSIQADVNSINNLIS